MTIAGVSVMVAIMIVIEIETTIVVLEKRMEVK